MATLSREERVGVTEATIAAAGGRVPIVVHTSSLSTRETIELSVHAERAGAAAVMVMAPFYEPLRWSEFVAHLKAVDDAIGIPIMLYNLPMATGVTMSPRQIVDLADAVAGVRYVKDSTGNASILSALLELHNDKIQVLNGWDTLTFFGFAAGARACVWGAATFMPELCVALFEALVIEADLHKARALWRKVWPICAFLETEGYVSVVKAACALLGEPIGDPRPPFQPLERETEGQLRRLLASADLIAARP
jgi:dihydrodipicolinate synthase/N-acetylneuraminate lyase